MRRAERGDCAGSLRRAWVALPVLLIWAGPLMAQTSEQVQKAADEAIRRLDLQTEFPRGAEPLSWHLDLPPETLWVVLAIALGILAYAFRDLIPILRAGSGRIAQAEETAPGVTTPGAQAVVIEAADELAAHGRFVEAMHLLLLHGLAHIRQRLDQQFSDSLTSREILHSTNLPEAARTSLRDVVGRVELTYFGQRPAGLTDYTACRESFNALGRALYGSAPA
jgi:hypothetical protein